MGKWRSFLADWTTNVPIVVFFGLSVWLMLNHEPWRDEAQAWLIARDSPDLASLLHGVSYEGTPALWHLMLFALSKLGLPYISMRIAHSLIALASATVFVKCAPFPKLFRILFIFGYYAFYEYNIVARSYALSVLFLFLIAALYRRRFDKPVLYAVLLLLLSSTNVHSLLIAMVLSGAYFYEMFIRGDFRRARSYISLSIVALGFLIAVYQLLPPPDIMMDVTSLPLNAIVERGDWIPDVFVGAFLPIPFISPHFWNTKLLSLISPDLSILGYGSFLISLLFFIRKPKPMLMYLLSTSALLGVFLMKHRGTLHHHGLIFVLFIFCLWIANEYGERRADGPRPVARTIARTASAILLGVLLVVQFVASPIALYYDLNYEFSSSAKAARFLKENGLANNYDFIAAYPSYNAAPVLAHLPRSDLQFYLVEQQRYGSYLVWDKKWAESQRLTVDQVLDRVDKATLSRYYENALLILDGEVKGNSRFDDRYALIGRFDQEVEASESYYVYRLKSK